MAQRHHTSAADEENGATTTVENRALKAVMEFVIGDPALGSAPDELLDAVRHLHARSHGLDEGDICGLCTTAFGRATHNAIYGDDRIVVCDTHADALDDGSWDGESHPVWPLVDPDEPVDGEIVDREWIDPATLQVTVSTRDVTYVERFVHDHTQALPPVEDRLSTRRDD